MKILFFILSIIIGAASWSQENSLELNSNQEYEYIEVVPFDSISKSTLYNAAIKWITDTYNYPDKVISFKDEQSGSIVINSLFNCTTYPLAAGSVYFRCQLEFKENKIRFTFNNFTYSSTTGTKTAFESNMIYKKSQLLKDTRFDVDQLITSLKNSVITSTSITTTDDW